MNLDPPDTSAGTDVFISYARADRDQVGALASALEDEGFSVWWDRELTAGENFADAIEQHLIGARCVVVAWSHDASKSRWVRDEAALAADEGKIVAVSLDGSDPPIGFRQYHSVSLAGERSSRGASVNEIIRAVRAKVSGRPASSARAETPRKKTLIRKRHVAIATSLALIAAIAAFIFFKTFPEDLNRPVVAVLPFTDLGNAGDGFSDGLGEELINALASNEHLDVISRSSSFSYREKDIALPEIASRLGATHVFEGSVRRHDGQLRVSARLVDGQSGIELWAEQFDRDMEHIFEIQSDISVSVAQAAGEELGLSSDVVARPTKSPEAYELYLKAQGLWSQRGEESIRRSIALLQTATKLDPEFARAWSMLGSAWLTLPGYTRALGENERPYDRARAASEKALELDPMLSKPYAVLANLKRHAHEYAEAENLFNRAIENVPSDMTSIYWYGEFLREVGRLEGASKQFQQAIALDPLSPTVVTDMGMINLRGDLENAKAHLARAWFELGFKSPIVWEGFWVIYVSESQTDEAEAWLDELLFPSARPIFESFLNAFEDASATPAAVQEITHAVRENRFPAWTAYMMLNWLGEATAAVELVSEQSYFSQTVVLFLPQTHAARRLPGFWPLVTRLGFSEYWLETGSWPDFCRIELRESECRDAALAAQEGQ